VQVRFQHQNVERRFTPDVETAAYRIVQEALTNVARHAGPLKEGVMVRVWATQDSLSVQIEDQGRGFVSEAVMADSRSSGLAGMRERVMLLNGQLTIDSRPGAGTQITAELPLDGSGGEDNTST
jgi:signal transduction histidine kinase